MSDERKDITEAEEKPKAPKWFKRESMFRAEVDLGDIVEGGKFTLRSARGREAKRLAPLAPKVIGWGKNDKGEEVPREWEPNSWEFNAAICAAYLGEIEGCEDLMDSARPEKRTSIKEWGDWLEGVDENLIARFLTAITVFRSDVFSDDADTGDTGNASSAPSGG